MVPQTPSSDLVHAIGLALRNEPAHDGMLSVIPGGTRDASGGCPRASLSATSPHGGFTFGVAWAVARSQDPNERDEVVAEEALAAAHVVFNEYMGDAEWAVANRRPAIAGRSHVARGSSREASGANGHTGWKELAR